MNAKSAANGKLLQHPFAALQAICRLVVAEPFAFNRMSADAVTGSSFCCN